MPPTRCRSSFRQCRYPPPLLHGYIRMMEQRGLTRATKIAILSAPTTWQPASRIHYGIVYRGATGFVGHEMILECRKVHEETGISENDIAKRPMDYGYHAPTLSFPVHGTLMIEPTESEKPCRTRQLCPRDADHLGRDSRGEERRSRQDGQRAGECPASRIRSGSRHMGAQLYPPKGSLPDRKRARKQVLGERGTRRQHVGRP